MICVYALNRNKYSELYMYLPNMFQTSNTKLINIHLTNSPKLDHLHKLCLHIQEENNCLILTY